MQATKTEAPTTSDVKTPTIVDYIKAFLIMAYKLGVDKRYRAFIMLDKLRQAEAPDMDPDVWLAQERKKVQDSLDFMDRAPKNLTFSPKLIKAVLGEEMSFKANRTVHFLIENQGSSGSLIGTAKRIFKNTGIDAKTATDKLTILAAKLEASETD